MRREDRQMKRIFGIAGLSRRWKLGLATGLLMVAVALGAGAVAYATIPSASDGTITGCYSTNGSKANGGTALNIVDTQSASCSKGQTPVQWNSGNADSTVRHISNFMSNGTTVTTPVLSAKGEIGKLSLTCGYDGSGGTGTIGFTQSSLPSFQDRVIFYSPEVPSSPVQTLAPASFSWADTPGDNIIFEVMIEAEPGSTVAKPTLTDIHGFVQQFGTDGCAFWVHVDTSEVNSGETFTP
jgi:hypothetical protein